jgi:hypothetical protein
LRRHTPVCIGNVPDSDIAFVDSALCWYATVNRKENPNADRPYFGLFPGRNSRETIVTDREFGSLNSDTFQHQFDCG